MEKMTNVKALNYVKTNFGEELPTDVAEKIDAMITSFQKKSANRKATATQKENEVIKGVILNILGDRRMTVTEILSELVSSEVVSADTSNQKITSLMRQLKEMNFVDKDKEGKRTVFFRNNG